MTVKGVPATALACLLVAATLVAAETVRDLQANLTRLQQSQSGLRQSLNELHDVPAKWQARTSALETRLRRVESTGRSRGSIDPNARVEEVLRASYLETTEDLRFYAEKVKYFNATKKVVRDYLEQPEPPEISLTGPLSALYLRVATKKGHQNANL